MSRFSTAAKEVRDSFSGGPEVSRTASHKEEASSPSAFSRIALEVHGALRGDVRVAHQDIPQERNAEWQRVNSLIADVLKDSSVLYSKIARLQGDFIGQEMSQLEDIANKVRGISNELSTFSEDFSQGEAVMAPSQTPFGGGGQPGMPGTPAPAPAPAPAPESGEPDVEADMDFDLEAEITDEDEELDKEFEDSE